MIISLWGCQGSAAPENRAHTHSYPKCMTNYLSINGSSLFKHCWVLPLLTSIPPTAPNHNPAQRPNNPCFSPYSVENKIPWLHYIFQKPLRAHLEPHLLSNTCNYVNDSVGLQGQFKEGLKGAEHSTHSPGGAGGTCSLSMGVGPSSPWGSPATSTMEWGRKSS